MPVDAILGEPVLVEVGLANRQLNLAADPPLQSLLQKSGVWINRAAGVGGPVFVFGRMGTHQMGKRRKVDRRTRNEGPEHRKVGSSGSELGYWVHEVSRGGSTIGSGKRLTRWLP
ncbi:MAG: hypothetical protein H6652_15350 [Ardenticatenaceae bacterium]|nr:hypothetical protein [Ardenticatenaceae bacterium]